MAINRAAPHLLADHAESALESKVEHVRGGVVLGDKGASCVVDCEGEGVADLEAAAGHLRRARGGTVRRGGGGTVREGGGGGDTVREEEARSEKRRRHGQRDTVREGRRRHGHLPPTTL